MKDLCTACLCSGRNLNLLEDTGYYHIYSQILNEISIYNLSQFHIKICWECCATLKRFDCFKNHVKSSYLELMQYVNDGIQPNKITSKPGRLISKQVLSISYPDIKLEVDSLQPDEQTDTQNFTSVLVNYVKDDDDDEKLGDEVSVIDDVKNEEHVEPESFVNDYKIEKRGRKKKIDKNKTKPKVKKKKVKVKKSVKSKKKENIIKSDDSCREYDDIDNGFQDDRLEEDDDDKKCDIFEKNDEFIPDDENAPLKPVKRKPITREPIKLSGNGKPECGECGKVFSSKKTLRYHLSVLHKGNNSHPCPRCGKVYQWKSNLGRHMRSHKARDSGELYCETCDKRFASVATYRQHLTISKQHVSENEFSHICNECGKKFVNKTRLRDHIDWEHLQKIKFRCQQCNKPFKCHTSLYVHMKNVHRSKDMKDNLCHVCGKSYPNRAKLRYHIVAMHTTETPYQCSQCNAAFGWYSSLYRHVREVHYKMKLQRNTCRKSKKKTQEPLPPMMPPLPPLPQGPNLLANYILGPNQDNDVQTNVIVNKPLSQPK